MEKYYRHRLLRKIQDKEWFDSGFSFSQLPPDIFIKKLKIDRDEYLAGGGEYHYDYKIIFTHEITKEEYESLSEYSIPLNQYIFLPFYFKL